MKDTSNTKLRGKLKTVWEMGNAGKSIAEISDAVNRCSSDVIEMYEEAHILIKGQSGPFADFLSLTRRARHAMLSFYSDCVPSKAKVALDVKRGSFVPKKIRAVGKDTAAEILAWAGVPKTCPHCGSILHK